jgi:hypothetical protein
MEYDMEEFMQSCVDRYVELSGTAIRQLAFGTYSVQLRIAPQTPKP